MAWPLAFTEEGNRRTSIGLPAVAEEENRRTSAIYLESRKRETEEPQDEGRSELGCTEGLARCYTSSANRQLAARAKRRLVVPCSAGRGDPKDKGLIGEDACR